MPDIYINTDRPVDRSIVAGINQPQREAPIGAFVAGSSYDTNLYFVRNDGTYDAASGGAGASVQVAISTLGKPQSGTFTLTDGVDTTSAIEYGASALEVQTALNALNSGLGIAVLTAEDSYLVSGAGTTETNGLYVRNGDSGGFPRYSLYAADGTMVLWDIEYLVGNWSILVGADHPSLVEGASYYSATDVSGTPPITGWSLSFGSAAESPAPTLKNTGTPQVTAEKVSDQQYAITLASLGAAEVISGSNVSLYPESTPTASIAVAGSETTNAQQIIEITRQPAVYQATWSTIANGFNATLALNTTRLLQSLLIDAGLPFYIEVKLNSETVAREVVGMEPSTMPASAFSATGLATLLDTFAASPASNAAFSASTWAAALNRLSGWASYTDTTRTSGSPYVLAADTDAHFQIEASTVVDSQKPSDITTFYTGSPTYLITGRDGDNLDVMLYFKAVPSTANQWLDIWVDIGGDVGEIYRQSFSFPRGVGVERGILYALPSAFTLATWEENGGKIYIRSNASLSIYNITINLDRSHKAR